MSSGTARPATRMYKPPEGTYDQPFTWIYDASNLTDGVDALNQIVYIKAGFGDFICRRIVGLASVLNPTGGQFQIYDRWIRPLYSAPTNVTGTDTDDQMLIRELDYPETSAIRLDLYDVLRDPSLAISKPPVQVDTSGTLESGFPGTNNATDCGPWLYAGDLFTALVENNFGVSPPLPGTVNVFRSTNNGASWHLEDAAGAPSNTLTATPDFSTSVNLATGILTVAWVKNSGAPYNLSFATFNFNTLVWTSGVTASITDLNDTFTFCFAVRSDGSIVCLYKQQTTNATVYRIYSGGAWGAAQAATPGTGGHNYNAANVIYDAGSGISHLIYSDNNGSHVTWTDVELSALNVLGSPTAIAADLQLNGDTMFNGTSNGTVLTIPMVRVSGAGAQTRASVFVGTPIHNPVWTVQDLEQTSTAFLTVFDAAVLNVSASLIYAAWSINAGIGVTPHVIHISTGIIAGGVITWDAPALYYDGVANPPPDGSVAGQQYIQNVALVIDSSGALSGLATMTDAALNFVAYALIGTSSSITAQIAFQGVRRQPGPPPQIAPYCPFEPRAYSYTQTVTIDAAGPAPVGIPTVSIFQTVNDYDFELDAVIITYSSGATLPRVVTMVQLYDSVKNVTSNIPMLDVYMNGAPGSPYVNGSQVPPLVYPNQTQIRLDVYSMIAASYLPVTMNVEFRGRQRYPCANC